MIKTISNLETYKNNYLSNLKDSSIKEAMIYVLDGGQRIRAKLIFSIVKGFDIDEKIAYNTALALEMIHAYSLVHDDLPCMDDDDMRRGKASCHIAFKESEAVLCGDALLTESFNVIANDGYLNDYQKLNIIKTYSSLAGVNGMIYGQYLDLKYENVTNVNPDIISNIALYKTGCLFKAALYAAMYIANDEKNMVFYDKLADKIGIAFQMQDDLFDITKTSVEMGKPKGSDIKDNKATALSIYDVDSLKNELANAYLDIINLIKKQDFNTSYLIELINDIKER